MVLSEDSEPWEIYLECKTLADLQLHLDLACVLKLRQCVYAYSSKYKAKYATVEAAFFAHRLMSLGRSKHLTTTSQVTHCVLSLSPTLVLLHPLLCLTTDPHAAVVSLLQSEDGAEDDNSEEEDHDSEEEMEKEIAAYHDDSDADDRARGRSGGSDGGDGNDEDDECAEDDENNRGKQHAGRCRGCTELRAHCDELSHQLEANASVQEVELELEETKTALLAAQAGANKYDALLLKWNELVPKYNRLRDTVEEKGWKKEKRPKQEVPELQGAADPSSSASPLSRSLQSSSSPATRPSSSFRPDKPGRAAVPQQLSTSSDADTDPTPETTSKKSRRSAPSMPGSPFNDDRLARLVKDYNDAGLCALIFYHHRSFSAAQKGRKLEKGALPRMSGRLVLVELPLVALVNLAFGDGNTEDEEKDGKKKKQRRKLVQFRPFNRRWGSTECAPSTIQQQVFAKLDANAVAVATGKPLSNHKEIASPSTRAKALAFWKENNPEQEVSSLQSLRNRTPKLSTPTLLWAAQTKPPPELDEILVKWRGDNAASALQSAEGPPRKRRREGKEGSRARVASEGKKHAEAKGALAEEGEEESADEEAGDDADAGEEITAKSALRTRTTTAGRKRKLEPSP